MNIGILQRGTPPGTLRAEHGSYGAMVQKLLGAGRDTAIYHGTAAALPASVTGYNAHLLTGSPAGVYGDLPWIPGLIRFLRQARGQAKLDGIYFGHQAMARAFDGEVV